MNEGFQYGDLIFLGLIALFVALRLRAMLGRNIGLDPRERWRTAAREMPQAQPAAPIDKTARYFAQPESPAPSVAASPAAGAVLEQIQAQDEHFRPAEFIAGAKAAFEWVLDAFAKGDKTRLKSLLSEERFRHFAAEIDARTGQETQHETTLVAIIATDVTEAHFTPPRAQITLQFTSEQIHVTRDAERNVVAGDASALEQVIDVWTFERDVTSRDPNWKITAT